jgi:TM2 domain-containing membrane protein YozV
MQGVAWFQANATNFPSSQRMIIQKRCSEMPDDRLMMLQQMKWKNPTVVLIVGILFGWAGFDRFMMGNIFLGLFKFFTGGFMGILWLIDLFILPGRAREANMKQIQPYL